MSVTVQKMQSTRYSHVTSAVIEPDSYPTTALFVNKNMHSEKNILLIPPPNLSRAHISAVADPLLCRDSNLMQSNEVNMGQQDGGTDGLKMGVSGLGWVGCSGYRRRKRLRFVSVHYSSLSTKTSHPVTLIFLFRL